MIVGTIKGRSLIVAGRPYEQSYDMMAALADSTMLQADWAASVGLI